jgi:hypothetical protein
VELLHWLKWHQLHEKDYPLWQSKVSKVRVRATELHRAVAVCLHSFVTSTLGEVSGQLRVPTTLSRRKIWYRSTHWIRGCVHPKAGFSSRHTKWNDLIADVQNCTLVVITATGQSLLLEPDDRGTRSFVGKHSPKYGLCNVTSQKNHNFRTTAVRMSSLASNVAAEYAAQIIWLLNTHFCRSSAYDGELIWSKRVGVCWSENYRRKNARSWSEYISQQTTIFRLGSDIHHSI